MVHLEVQPPHTHGDGAGHAEDVHLRQARDAPVVQVDLQHALVEGFGRAGFVLLYDAVARLLDDAHEGGALEAGLQGLGPGHGEEEEGGEVSHRGVPRVRFVQLINSRFGGLPVIIIEFIMAFSNVYKIRIQNF